MDVTMVTTRKSEMREGRIRETGLLYDILYDNNICRTMITIYAEQWNKNIEVLRSIQSCFVAMQ
jgi:hypothetical protein